jgi:molecular chaperone GrpE
VTQDNKPQPGNPTETEGAPTGEATAGEGPASTPAPSSERAALAEAQAEAARYKDQLLRTAADFDNFRKRSRRELEDAERRGRDDLLKEFLPVFDNLERATLHAASTEATGGVKALAEGIGLVIRQFTDTLRKIGIERIEAVGKPFDPSQHEAIQHLESAEFEPGTVAAEVQAGYRAGERLVRPALVVVAKRPAAAVADETKPVDVDPGEPTPED